MPIEIKELHIRVAVNAAPEAKVPASRGPATGSQRRGSPDKDAIVAECVEQVLQILQNQSER